MLTWKRVDGSWLGNGFRVRQVAPRLWSLEHLAGHRPVDVTEPIAQLATLEACKHKAEAIHREERVRDQRRRLLAVGVGGWSLALLLGSPVGFIIGGVIGSAALLELITTWTDGRVGGVRSYVQ